jgi:formate hydrogenlyase transcriptional activator
MFLTNSVRMEDEQRVPFPGTDYLQERQADADAIIGESARLKAVLQEVSLVAPTDSTVLILGETGTGKELIARAIHKQSKRSGGPFIRVNCAAIPSSLIASELFGHEKGAFTGALERRLGRFESANHGTIFLDEIGELPMETQIVLLRVLQERELERIGSSRPVPIDVRIIAATNRDLKAAVEDGTFRLDLFYRLNVFPIEMPPLRERVEDIPSLVAHLLQKHSKALGKSFRSISSQSLEAMRTYSWPGNIRELQNVVERAAVLSTGDVFSVHETWLQQEFRQRPAPEAPTAPAGPLMAVLADGERRMIEAALAESRGRISGPAGAAARLGIPRQTLDSKIAGFGIDKRRFKTQSLS